MFLFVVLTSSSGSRVTCSEMRACEPYGIYGTYCIGLPNGFTFCTLSNQPNTASHVGGRWDAWDDWMDCLMDA